MNRSAAWTMLQAAVLHQYDQEIFKLKQEAEKKRRANRKRSIASKERTLQWKKKNALKKHNRQGVRSDE